MTQLKYAIIFPDQGGQYPDMGLDFVKHASQARTLFERVSQACGIDLQAIITDRFDLLEQSRYAQLAISAVSLAIYETIQPLLGQPSYMAGLSLGEYSALMAADYISYEAGFKLLQKRAGLMSDHCQTLRQEAGPLGMVAVIKMPLAEIKKILKGLQDGGGKIYIANLNASHQTIIGGDQEPLEAFVQAAKEAGYKKCLPLKVEGPFHTPLMQGICQDYAKILAAFSFQNPNTPVISNTTLQIHQPGPEMKENLVRHLVEPVHWSETIDFLAGQGVDCLIQVGPGKSLANLLKREKQAPKCITVDKFEDLDSLVSQLEEVINGK